MKKPELSEALKIAQSNEDLSNEDISIFNGFGLTGFAPVYVTTKQVARLIRWQAGLMDGTWDSAAIQEIMLFGRKRFQII